MRSPLRALVPLVITLIGGCASTASAPDAGAARAAEWMTGSFSSAAQSVADPDYYDIRLFMVPIWEERTDGEWLYVEQAVATALERPYRQRVYHVVDTPEGPRSDVFELPGDPIFFVGGWRHPDLFDAITPKSLSLREGCSIYLKAVGDHFVGSTRGTGCRSSVGDAAYAASEVVVRPDALTSWDRGFDAAGAQAWGAEKGPYVFRRVLEGRAPSGVSPAR